MTKNEIKFIQGLAEKKNRIESQNFVVEGPKMIEELVKSNFIIEKIFFTDNIAHFPDSIPSEQISPVEMQKISQFKTASNILALAQIPKEETVAASNGWIIALDNIQDPGNLGTIIRIADWFGIEQIIASPESADCYNSKVIQATMGGIFRVKIHYQSLSEFIQAHPLPIYGALLEGVNIFEQKKLPTGILVIGNESKGISTEIKQLITKPLTIPRIGHAESLNAAVATGILTAILTS